MLKRTVIASSILAMSPVFAQEEEKKAFTMDGEFGLILTTGNTETASFTGSLTASQELEDWQNDYLIEGLYRQESVVNDAGEDETRASAQQFFASAQGNYKLENPKHRLFVFASYEDDRFGGFKYQATVAGGWNQQVWETEKTALEYSIGPGYAFQEEQDGTDASSMVVRGSAAFNWFISETAKFTQNVATEVGKDNTKTRAETALTAQISGALSMRISFQIDHNSDVPADREKLDTETAVTLVYSFF